ncbi:MAG: hypothetical protein QOG23_2003 [Blastocatellia bacterium]|jgi:hypothetical protein|nr:hypothetical protein [Blastocatellia bacterium]
MPRAASCGLDWKIVDLGGSPLESKSKFSFLIPKFYENSAATLELPARARPGVGTLG